MTPVEKSERERRSQFELLIEQFRSECSPMCDCPCALDGPQDSPDSVFRTHHTIECSVRKFADAAFEAGRSAGEAGLRERLTDLLDCWDVFYMYLPDGEYRGIGQMRAAANQHRAWLAGPIADKGDGNG